MQSQHLIPSNVQDHTTRTAFNRKNLKLKIGQNSMKTNKNTQIRIQIMMKDFEEINRQTAKYEKQKQNMDLNHEIKVSEGSSEYEQICTPQKTRKVTSKSPLCDRFHKNSQIFEQKCKNWEITDFQILKTMGRGKFGTVFAAQQKISKYLVAIKQMNRKQLKHHNFQSQVKRQIQIQANLSHKNLLKLFGYFWDLQNIYIVLEYAPGGELLNFMKISSYFQEGKVSAIIREVCNGLEYLHQESIIHRDIKPENILVSCDGIKLADFGWSVQSENRRETLCGTLDYLAPEIVKGETHDNKIDIWQIGILAYELAVGRPPFQTKTFNETYIKIMKDQVKFPFHISFQLRQFIRSILIKDPNKRPTLHQILRHPFIRKYEQISHNLIEKKHH